MTRVLLVIFDLSSVVLSEGIRRIEWQEGVSALSGQRSAKIPFSFKALELVNSSDIWIKLYASNTDY